MTEHAQAHLPYPALTDEPDIVKFVRVDATHYPGEYAPEAYDPLAAQKVYAEVIEEAVEAEALGWDGFFFTEHHFDAWSLAPSPNLLLAALAMKTRKMRLGTGVHILPVHDPVRLAEEAGMLDVMSGGRLEVGLGRGNFQFELDRFTAPAAESVARFDEHLDVFTKALRANRFTYDGRWTQVRKPATVYPRPMQAALPVWIGATSSATVEKVGQLGHNLAGGAFPDRGERLARFTAAAQKAGRTMSGANFMALSPLFVAPTDAEAERIVGAVSAQMRPFALKRVEDGAAAPASLTAAALADFSIFGSPQTVRDKLVHILTGCGARRFMGILRFRGTSTEIVRQTQKLFAEEVAPALRNLKTN
ncbi:MAG TPA: LLM class flavin-dependent oxidoreductase [Stellaceae bacterium]|jgi:alkanesulfonate monooxygenase SsuD/methylene tetrahydromethanopterin reductase-like flavin-dependent oxidoreductase (luciferase family)|nr:LLM class flavin-dependent oxidoreductase [Stellaceae bacterium]